MEAGDKDKYAIKSVEKAIKVVRTLLTNRIDEMMSVSEVAKRAAIDKSTCYRILVTLCEQGIVCQAPSGRYRVGIGLVQIGQTALIKVPFTALATDIMRKLSAATGESAYLFMYSNYSRICIAKHESPQLIRHYIPIGEPIPLYVGSSGKVLLAAMSNDQLNRYLKAIERVKLGPNTITSEIVLREEIRKIRLEGISISVKERSNDSASIGFPIRNANGAVVAALSIAGPAERFIRPNLTEWEIRVREAGSEMSQILGYDRNLVRERWVLEKLN